MNKITVEEKTKSPAILGPRIIIWASGIFLSFYSNGLTLILIPIFEAGLHAEKRRACEELDKLNPHAREEAESVFNDTISQGIKNATISYGSQTDGWGHVSKEITYSIEDHDD